MRLSVLRLIAARELRDLLRDRRSVLIIVLMPILLYPLFGLAAILFALSMTAQRTVVGVVGLDRLPKEPALVADGTFDKVWVGDDPEEAFGPLVVRPLEEDSATALREKRVDVVLSVPEGFAASLVNRSKPKLTIDHRDGDEKSKLASKRLRTILRNWEARLREERFLRADLPKDFDRVFELVDPITSQPKQKQAADELRDTLARFLPFILLLWLVTGAMQPAVDLTAGEKERGTMETLLISPAERTEIVAGKFVAVTAYSFSAVVWNAIWLGAACAGMQAVFGYPIVNMAGLVGCVALGFPLAMLFSAICLAFGVFARSTKEGQYYLLPLILLMLPLAIASMLPGQELDAGNAFVPVLGAMLLQQKLLAVGTDPVPWGMFAPVLGSLAVSVVLALALAVRQFRRESVLFRELGPDKGGRFAKYFGP
jgi:sodium transport system permease protein